MTFKEFMKEVGYDLMTTFWEDFSIADKYGIAGVKDTYKRAFDEWKGNYKFFAELVIVLNHKIWQHYESNRKLAALNHKNMYENILSNMLGCQTYCISDSPSNRYCLIGPIECNEKLIEVFKKGITVKLKYVEKRVLDTFTDNGINLSNYTHCIIVKRNFYLAW